jgi:hypothetical protein
MSLDRRIRGFSGASRYSIPLAGAADGSVSSIKK